MRTLLYLTVAFLALSTCFLMLSRGDAEPSAKVLRAEDLGNGEVSETIEDRAERLFLRGEYEDAATAYRAVVRDDPENGLAWVRLAYATHESGDFEVALALHERASEFPENQLTSLFKLACAMARLSRKEDALLALERAVEAGYRDRRRTEEESELESLRGEERFERVLNRMAPPPEVRVSWTSGSATGRFETRKVVAPPASQQFNGSRKVICTWSTGPILAVDRVAAWSSLIRRMAPWEMVRVHDGGEVHRLRGQFENGALRLEGQRIEHAGQVFPLKIVLEHQENRGIYRSLDYSKDDRKSWVRLSEGYLVPEEPVWTGRSRR